MLWDDFRHALHQQSISRAVFKMTKIPVWIGHQPLESNGKAAYLIGDEFICVSYVDEKNLTMRNLRNKRQINAGAGYFKFVQMRSFPL